MVSTANNFKKIIPLFTGIIFLFLLGSNSAKSQSYHFDNYNVEEGLGQSKVFSIIQAQNHQIWLATLSGASRFDGQTFRNFTSEDGLAENSVRSLFEDSKGNIWFGHSEGGLSRYNGKIFEHFPAGFLLNKDVTGFAENKEGGLWIISAGAGAVLISNPGAPIQDIKFERYKGNRLSDMVYACYRMSDDRIYFITDAGIKIYNEKNNSFFNFNPPSLPKYFQYTSICEDKKGNIWIGTHNGGLYQYIVKKDTVKIYDARDGLGSNFISFLYPDKKGNIWAGTWGQGATCVTSDGQLKVYNTKNGLGDNYIFRIIEDAEGNILIGTTAHGLFVFKGEAMVNFSQPDALMNKQVSAILEDREKRIWFGTNNGISIYNPLAGGEVKFAHYTPENSIISEQIRFLKKDLNNDIWIGSDEYGVFFYDNQKKTFSSPFELNSLLPEDKGVLSLEVDHNNTIWVGTMDGLVSFNKSTLTGKRLSTLNGLAGNYITALFCSSDSTLYIGSKGKGMTVMRDTTKKIFKLDNSETPLCFTEGPDGTIWIGTESHGLIGFKNEKIIKRYSLREGMLSNLINFVNCDAEGNLYCGTNKGLNKIEVARNKIYIYSKRNGFLGKEARKNATYKDSEGYLWFGTVNGAVRYSPGLDDPGTIQPLTHIRKITVNQVEYDLNQPLVFNSGQNSVTLEYISICLRNPDAVLYQVKLDGIDDDWQPVTTHTSITYPALPPNKYVFQVRARNSNGVWNTIPATVSFEIMPPFYMRWYFILSFVCVMIVVLIVFIKLREKTLIVEKSVLEERVQERTYEVMHMNEELAMKNKDVLASIEYAKRIQLSVLPSVIPFDNTFVLFKPKDIVSGDFFWFMEDETYEWMAAVDCTGHGVPGAFMSLIGYNSLNKIVREMKIKLPSEILNQLNDEVTKTLHQYGKEESISDGMDIALVRYNKQTHVLDYAGAFNPLWIIRRRELLETRADRFAIGRTPHEGKTFSNDTTQLQPDDTIYLFTDGYADQFGGVDNKKYKTAKFKEFVINIQQYSIPIQKEMLEENIEKWRGNNIQVDDILVMGRKFKF